MWHTHRSVKNLIRHVRHWRVMQAADRKIRPAMSSGFHREKHWHGDSDDRMTHSITESLNGKNVEWDGKGERRTIPANDFAPWRSGAKRHTARLATSAKCHGTKRRAVGRCGGRHGVPTMDGMMGRLTDDEGQKPVQKPMMISMMIGVLYRRRWSSGT